ncbi:MAG: ABC transporter permease [Anaerolineales bacterium]|nr:ABC transporter permease [Anaerolineales bacterium]
MVAAASQSMLVVVDRDLTNYWRTTYDILVRPSGARSPIEEDYGLVEANHLSGTSGGITFEQYEAIRNIPGVEVAAPIAMIGYLAQSVPVADLGTLPEVGAYRQTDTLTVDDGARAYQMIRFKDYFAVEGENPALGTSDQGLILLRPRYFPHSLNSIFEMPMLLAAIDPAQEASLVGLDSALVSGNYLSNDAPLITQNDKGVGMGAAGLSVPVLINSTSYVVLNAQSEVEQFLLPEEASSLEAVLARGGIKFLRTLPTEPIVQYSLDGATAYGRLVTSLLFFGGLIDEPTDFMPVSTIHTFLWSVPSQIAYRTISSPVGEDQGLVLEVIPGERPANRMGWDVLSPSYRSLPQEGAVTSEFALRAVGVFNLERLPKPADVSRVPLETYFPPVAILRYDEQGRPIDPPRELRPTLNPAGYIQPPPLLLTTLDVARALRGDSAISAIRVRVAGIGQLTPAAQRKIETVAIEIIRRTGLSVDVMVGSSPRRILVRVPGIGYVEEQWIQKGVNLVYKQGIQTGNWLLLTTLLAAGVLYTLNLSWAEVVAQRRLIALRKALGWRSRTVFAQVIGQVLRIGMVATMVGTLGAFGTIWLFNWQWPPASLLLGLPLAVLGVPALGCLVPAWLASRTPPVVELQQSGLRYRREKKGSLALGLWAYAWSGLMRRPGQAVLTGLTAVLSAALLVLLLTVTLEQRGILSGTLLGEFILVHVQQLHYAIVGIGLGLTAFSTANRLLAGVIERHREIGVLKAIGWRTRAVASLFVVEGVLLGLAGGALGALLGSLVFAYLHGVLLPGLVPAIAAGVSMPALVGALAALYPAYVAARVPAAEAVRYG